MEQDGTKSNDGRIPDHIIDARVDIVYDWMLAGKKRRDIVKDGFVQWEINARAVDEYIAKAKQRLREESEDQLIPLKEAALIRWTEFINRCKTANDRKNELGAGKHIDMIQGLLTTKIDHTTKGESINKIQIEIINTNKDEQ